MKKWYFKSACEKLAQTEHTEADYYPAGEPRKRLREKTEEVERKE